MTAAEAAEESGFERDCVDNAERYILRAAAAFSAGVPDEEIRERLEKEGCDPDQVGLLIVAGKQLSRQQEEGFFGTGARETSREGTPEEEECHVCQPFTKLVRDPEKLKACMKIAEPLGDLKDARKLYELTKGDLQRQDQEVFVVVCLDFRGALRDYAEVARGQRHRVAVDIEDITRIVIASARDAGCDGYVVLHCHPTGVAEPSDADGDLTQSIKKATGVSLPTVHFLDHIVVGLDEFYSFAANDWSVDGKVQKVK